MNNVLGKFTLTAVALALLLLPTFSFAVRETEINYPPGPGDIETPVDIEMGLPDYIKYVFWLVISVSGLFCFASLVYAGFLFVTSAGSPTQHQKAKNRVQMAFLGGAIVLGSFLLSKTINPQLVIPKTEARPIGGVIVYADENCTGEEKIITQNNPDVDSPDNTTSIRFLSPPGQLEVRLYPNTDYKGEPKIVSSNIQATSSYKSAGDCYNANQPINSIRFIYKLPGVYLCSENYTVDPELETNICKGKEVFLRSGTALLDSEIEDEVLGVKIVPAYKVKGPFSTSEERNAECFSSRHYEKIVKWDLTTESGETQYYCNFPYYWYGVVLHENPDHTGKCHVIYHTKELTSVTSITGSPVDKDVSSVTIFMRVPYEEEEDLSGGVWLCEEPNAQRGEEGCYGPYQKELSLDAMTRSITSINVNDKGIEEDSISSIIIDGSYTAILLEEKDFSGKCEVFKESDSNLRDNPIGRCNCITSNWGCEDCLSSFIVIPDLRTSIEDLTP